MRRRGALAVLLLLLFLPAARSQGPREEAPPVPARAEVETPDGRRSFSLLIPPGCRLRSDNPLVLLYHDAGSDAAEAERLTGFAALAASGPFVLACPEGARGPLGRRDWNPGFLDTPAARAGVNESAFLDALLHAIGGTVSIDPSRVYLAGIGEGGMAALSLAAERAGRVAAVAACGAASAARAGRGRWRALPEPRGPVSALIVHGREDARVPFAGGRGRETPAGRRYAPARDLVARLVAANRCHPRPAERLQEGATVVERRYRFGLDGTEVIQVERAFGRDPWPGGAALSSRVLRFFLDHPKELGR